MSWYFVSFFFGMMLLSGQSGSTEHTLKIFLSAFSKSSQMYILLDAYFLLKHISRKFCMTMRSESTALLVNRQTISEIWYTLNRWSTSP